MENEVLKKGGISVETEHIFPVIKKWLYSDKDIFLREIVSNASDAVTKLKRLNSLGEADITDDWKITVTLDKAAKTLTVEDNGIGMTEEEVGKYLCQMALSGALDFVQKYEGTDQKNDGIIGHFGLGFYSAFMVSDVVEVNTKSYTGAPAVRFTCKESGEYEIAAGDREARGTEVILHITDEEEAYLDRYKIEGILNKYCAFMPVDIFFLVEGDDAEKKPEDGKEPEAPKPINDKNPLWLKNPSECTEEEYKAFYRKVFGDYRDPLFHVHINADYPLNFKGILYFPKITSEYESIEGQVKLYYNQVFVADNIKEVIPDYLLMLRGVLDCPELPLNVSRSYLQNNTYVTKVGNHIVKKVTDKLTSMCQNDRENYEKLWKDLKIFVEYGSMRDKKFYDRMKDAILLELTDGTFTTLPTYLEEAKEKHENTVYYTSDKALQAQYISMLNAEGIKVAVYDKPLDAQFLSLVESYVGNGLKFERVDADVAKALKGEGDEKTDETLEKLFREVSGNDKLTVKLQAFKSGEVPALLTVSEQSRRMEDMMKMYAMSGMDMGTNPFPTEATLTLNSASPLISGLAEKDAADHEKAKLIAGQIYRLSVLAQRKLSAEELKSFLADSFRLLGMI